MEKFKKLYDNFRFRYLFRESDKIDFVERYTLILALKDLYIDVHVIHNSSVNGRSLCIGYIYDDSLVTDYIHPGETKKHIMWYQAQWQNTQYNILNAKVGVIRDYLIGKKKNPTYDA